jgi:hypothetical protein
MEPMRVVWAGLVVIVQPPAAPAPWAGPSADHDLVLHQVSAWLAGLRQGAQAAPLLPAVPAAPSQLRRDEPADGADGPLPGFYL